jgi:biopolymer transport protein TolQ
MQDTSLWTFIIHADLVVKLVLVILVTASVISWTIILQRWFLLRKTRRLLRRFEKEFWAGSNLKKLLEQIPEKQSDLAQIFHAGYREYETLIAKKNMPAELIMENCQRVMRIAEQQCLQDLESNIPILATIGSTAPYVGLFGTVWGIMSSFRSLGGVQQATIAMVAPGISEALIATAVGLFAAIPAVVAYNRLANQVENIEQSYSTFREELTGILQQHVVLAENRGTQ